MKEEELTLVPVPGYRVHHGKAWREELGAAGLAVSAIREQTEEYPGVELLSFTLSLLNGASQPIFSSHLFFFLKKIVKSQPLALVCLFLSLSF